MANGWGGSKHKPRKAAKGRGGGKREKVRYLTISDSKESEPKFAVKRVQNSAKKSAKKAAKKAPAFKAPKKATKKTAAKAAKKAAKKKSAKRRK